jgi:hypothetical protein
MISLLTAASQIATPAPFSWRVLLTLLLVLILSAATFAALVRRWTTQRGELALSDWARGNGFRLARASDAPDLPRVSDTPLIARRAIRNQNTWLLELSPIEPAVERWHVLLRQIESRRKATGLRPTRAQRSVLDLFSLSSYPALGNTDRFVVYGTDARAAGSLSSGPARALLPPDVGLLLDDGWMMLDFSERRFDPIEFDRMTALAEQLVAHLPK